MNLRQDIDTTFPATPHSKIDLHHYLHPVNRHSRHPPMEQMVLVMNWQSRIGPPGPRRDWGRRMMEIGRSGGLVGKGCGEGWKAHPVHPPWHVSGPASLAQERRVHWPMQKATADVSVGPHGIEPCLQSLREYRLCLLRARHCLELLKVREATRPRFV